jgi:hypothetical protein
MNFVMAKINTKEGIRIFFNREFYHSLTPRQELINELEKIKEGGEKEAFLAYLLEFATMEHGKHLLTNEMLKQANPGENFTLPEMEKTRHLKSIIQEEILNVRESRYKMPEPEAPGAAQPEIPPAGNDCTNTATTSPNGPLSSLSNRQLALWRYYMEEAGEVERFGTYKKKVFEFAKQHLKEKGQSFYQKYWLKIRHTYNKASRYNLKDHKAILPHLDKATKAFTLAQRTLEKLSNQLP